MNISENEKEHLKNRILESVNQYKKRKVRNNLVFGMVTCVMIGLCVFYLKIIASNNFDTDNKYTELINYKLDTLKNVQLFLDDKKQVEVSGNEQMISYSSNGKEVKVGTGLIFQQNINGIEQNLNMIIVPYGKRSEISLSDRTKVWLNAGSKLIFPSNFTDKERVVYIEGEGIFDVQYDNKRPFIVKTKNQEIQVLGTVFNVSSYKEEQLFRTVLAKGAVKIKYKTDANISLKNSLELYPGMIAIYDQKNKKMQSEKVDVDQYFSWKNKVLICKDDALKTIMKKISRYYNIEIVINNPKLINVKFSGSLDLKYSVVELIDVIKLTSDFSYTMADNKLIIN